MTAVFLNRYFQLPLQEAAVAIAYNMNHSMRYGETASNSRKLRASFIIKAYYINEKLVNSVF